MKRSVYNKQEIAQKHTQYLRDIRCESVRFFLLMTSNRGCFLIHILRSSMMHLMHESTFATANLLPHVRKQEVNNRINSFQDAEQ